mmetsp:Transcript_12543/g.22783  ORF Transcript_12543/g.22783 Transcript_12543/m.22783 type:complete len:218 (-) Transcript_12543:613-1266(-)
MDSRMNELGTQGMAFSLFVFCLLVGLRIMAGSEVELLVRAFVLSANDAVACDAIFSRRQRLVSLVFVALMLSNGLDQKHHRHCRHSDEQQRHLHARLARVERVLDGAGGEEHFDHCLDEGGRLLADVDPVDTPLVNDHEAHVAEGAGHEEQLGNPHEVEGEVVFEVDVVECSQADTESHLRDADDDRHLHFERIEESELVLAVVPVPVDSVGVDLVV